MKKCVVRYGTGIPNGMSSDLNANLDGAPLPELKVGPLQLLADQGVELQCGAQPHTHLTLVLNL